MHKSIKLATAHLTNSTADFTNPRISEGCDTIRVHGLLERPRVLVSLSAFAISAKILLSSLSILSYDFTFLLKNLATNWMKAPVPYVTITGPFYELWLALPVNHPDLRIWIGGGPPPLEPSTYLLAFLVKLPILIADLVCAFLIKKLVDDHTSSSKGTLAAAIWLLNPYVLLTGEMQGSIELIPIASTLAGILFLKRRRVTLGSFFVGLGIALKLFPLLLLPALSIYYIRLRKVRDFLKILIGSMLGLSLYATWVSAWGIDFGGSLVNITPFTTIASELILTPYASKIGLATISALIFCFILCIHWVMREENLFDVVFGFLLAYMAFYDWWPQNLLWLVSFMTIDLVVSGKRARFYYVVLLLSAFLIGLILFEFAPLNSVFFVPAFTPPMESTSKLLHQIYQNINMVLIGSPISRSIYAGIALFYSLGICVRNSPRLKALFG